MISRTSCTVSGGPFCFIASVATYTSATSARADPPRQDKTRELADAALLKADEAIQRAGNVAHSMHALAAKVENMVGNMESANRFAITVFTLIALRTVPTHWLADGCAHAVSFPRADATS